MTFAMPFEAPAFRLSPQQARRWAELGPAATTARARCTVLLEGPLDPARLHLAALELTRQHEIVRTRYRPLAGTNTGVQSPAPAEEAPLTSTLTELGPGRYELVLELPALSTDRRGLVNLVASLAERYASHEPLEPVAQYADVAEVFHDLLVSPDAEAGRLQFRNVDLTRWLEPASPHEAESSSDPQPFAPRAAAVVLPAGHALERAASALEVPPEALLLATWHVLVHRLSDRGHARIAVAFDGRTYEGLDTAMGPFERLLPFRADLDPRAGLAELARATAAAVAGDLEWQDFFDLASALSAQGWSAGDEPVPYFPIAFAAFTWPAAIESGGVQFRITGLEPVVDRFDWKLVGVAREGGVAAELHYDAARFSERTAARWAERFATLLAAAIAEPDRAMAALPIVGPEESAELAQGNRTERPWSLEGAVHEHFDAQAARTPEREALRSGEAHLTYRGLAERANQLAHRLIALGAAPEDRIAICLERSMNQVVALLGVLKAGCAYVPIDPMLPPERAASILDQAGARLVLTQGSLRASLPAGPRTVQIDDPDEASILARAPREAPHRPTDPRQLAYVIFTSGSTGKPKGVMIQHGSVLNLAQALDESIYRPALARRARSDEPLRVSLNAPLAFDASVKQWVQLLSGHTLCVVPEEARLDARRMCDLVREQRLDVLDTTPSMLAGLVEQGLGRAPELSPALILVGGEPIEAALWRKLAGLRGTFVNVYGPTECTVDASSAEVASSPVPTIGGPLGNVRAYVLDAHLLPVPIGAIGELFIGGAGVGRGYAGQPAATAQRFVPDPAGPAGARLYRTGDLCRMREDGRLEFIGRNDGQVKLRGLRIELGEIESVMQSHPAVRHAVVDARRTPTGETRLVAYFVPREKVAAPGAIADLRAELRKTLPEYMVPSALVPMAAIPLTPNGKLDRAALPDPRESPDDGVRFEAPTSDIERTVVAIWQEVLGVARIGLHHNFFDLGGHSLLMVKVHERLATAFARPISMVELFRHPTVSALAKHLASGSAAKEADTSARADRQRAAREEQARRNRAGRRPR
ncbi:amino acid adenylation domain-containing protein [Pendulispora albinea]|uniref:Amino acid adenylation domain-containing protein n=1 Tax=Pendulispora albinea TaxID=2741071 RepID=A0ABZ2MA88_9BACT